jgi:hypothetical protein
LNINNISLIIGILGLLLGIFSVWQILSLNKLRKNFFAGTKALDLESVIESLRQELEDSRERQLVTENSLKILRQNFSFSIQKVGMVRFNPFGDGGGNFSFTIALLDQHNSGVIITSMHGREQNRIYTKKLEDGTCATKLTDEEEQAVLEAETKYRETNK